MALVFVALCRPTLTDFYLIEDPTLTGQNLQRNKFVVDEPPISGVEGKNISQAQQGNYSDANCDSQLWNGYYDIRSVEPSHRYDGETYVLS